MNALGTRRHFRSARGAWGTVRAASGVGGCFLGMGTRSGAVENCYHYWEGILRQHVLHHISGEVRAYALLKGLDLDVKRRLGVGLGRVV